jgi:hypothetical protein
LLYIALPMHSKLHVYVSKAFYVMSVYPFVGEFMCTVCCFLCLLRALRACCILFNALLCVRTVSCAIQYCVDACAMLCSLPIELCSVFGVLCTALCVCFCCALYCILSTPSPPPIMRVSTWNTHTRTQHTAYSTQHTAHSTQHTAHSTQHTAQLKASSYRAVQEHRGISHTRIAGTQEHRSTNNECELCVLRCSE